MSSRRSRSGGTTIGMTLSRKYRSSRNSPRWIACSRSLLVAAITRTSTLIVRAEPRRSTSCSCSTRSTLACVFGLMSPTSSRKIVPRSACSNLPICFSVAPVNDPFSWPNSSDSISSSGIAAQLTWTNRCPARGLLRWMVRATSSLPTPLSPSSSTVALVGAARLTASSTPRSAGLSPTISYFDSIASFSSRFSERSCGLAQRVLHGHDDALAAERLVEEVDGAGPDRLDGGRGRAVPGDHDDRQRFVERVQLAQDLDAVHARHLDVEQHEVGPIALHQRNARPGRCPRRRTRSPRIRGSSAANRGWPPRRR